MGKHIEVAEIDPKTGNPARDAKGGIITRRVDPRTGAEVKPAASKRAAGKATSSS